MQEKPEPLDVDAAIERVRDSNGDLAGLVATLDSDFESWSRYGQDRNYFGRGENNATHALWKARTGIVEAAQEMLKATNKFKKEAAEVKLRHELEEYTGPITQNLEAAVEKNQKRFTEPKEATHAENHRSLENGVLELTKEKEMERHADREGKSERFAEKYGITAEREAMLEAEREYVDAVRERDSKLFKINSRDEAATREPREKLEEKLAAWREALAKAGEEAETSGEKGDRISARFISARDTMTRMERARQGAVEESLDARSKSTLGTVDRWMNKVSGSILGAAGSAAATVGQGFNAASEFVGGKIVERFVDKEKDFEKYQKASRIVGGALITSAIFAPAGAITAGAAGFALLSRIGRGFLMGFGGGAFIGKHASKGYDWRHGTKEDRLKEHLGHLEERKELHAVLRGKKGSFQELDPEWLREVFKRPDAKKFEEKEAEHDLWRKRVELAAPILIGGMISYGAAHWPPVHDAIGTVDGPKPPPTGGPPHGAGLSKYAEATGGSHSEGGLGSAANHVSHGPEAHGAQVKIESVSVGGNVNDADRLFGRFVDNVRHQFPNPHDAPPALRTLLEQMHQSGGMHEQDVLTRWMHLQNGGSVTVHNGDTVSFENGKVMFQGHELIDEHGKLHDLQASKEIHMQHKHVAHSNEHPHAARSETVARPEATQQTPAQQPAQAATGQPPPAVNPAEPSTPETGPVIVPQDIHAQPTPQVVPLDQPTPSIDNTQHIGTGPRILPPDHFPVQPDRPAVAVPDAINDNHAAPPEAAHVAPAHEPILNRNGFDLANPRVGSDAHGNLFSHITRTGNLEQDNELSYQTALAHAAAHHEAPVYFVDESRNALGQVQRTVFGLKFNPDNTNWNYFPDRAHPESMPDVPRDIDLRNPR